MMKKYIALGVALVLLLSLTACGSKGDNNPDKDPGTTTTVMEDGTDGTTTDSSADGTTVADGDATTAGGGSASNGGATNGTQPIEPPTTQYIPGGTQVPIGTRPPTTTTATKAPTTTTTVTGSASVGNGTTASEATTTTTTTVTTTTTTVAKPTVPPANQHYIALPEIGTDIDVTGKKDRIRVSDAYAWFNEDGSIGVGLTFKNYTSNWITEETDYVQYICYDEEGTPLKRGTISLGVIDTKKHPVRTYEFDVPADTYEVKLSKSKITYWTEWA